MEREGEYRRKGAEIGSYFAQPEGGFVGVWWLYEVTGRRHNQIRKTDYKVNEWRGRFHVFDYGPRYAEIGVFSSLAETVRVLGGPMFRLAREA